MSDERTVKIGTFPDDGIIEESVEAYRQTVFTCQLDTLNAHPERWAMLKVWLIDAEGMFEFVEILEEGFAEFGLGDMDVDVARALLAAREAREGEAE